MTRYTAPEYCHEEKKKGHCRKTPSIRSLNARARKYPTSKISLFGKSGTPAREILHLIESRRPSGREELSRPPPGNSVRQREFEVLGEQLPDVGPLDVVRLGQLDDFDDLEAQRMKRH